MQIYNASDCWFSLCEQVKACVKEHYVWSGKAMDCLLLHNWKSVCVNLLDLSDLKAKESKQHIKFNGQTEVVMWTNAMKKSCKEHIETERNSLEATRKARRLLSSS